MYTHLHYRDKYGSYELSIENGIICAVIQGAIGESFSRRYNHDFCSLIDNLGKDKWGHYGDFRLCEALTPEAKHLSVELHKYALQKGCVVSAFQINSSLLVSQVDNVRKTSAINTSVTQKSFTTKAECFDYIERQLTLATRPIP
ncbi:MAG: hypothetical protein NWQ54_01075 [Paraglaciecola sp.]|uniref:hypothetical protein n=1 Tax=Pseudomonadati TaxID=3379134 RepID=UPI00273F7412|nr:hypothetical protein [Paraglaciecola sp.]MDP5030536.1 hypothetical protein [Paraglaciecola sp.]MDP5129443.1 hypothetical protein [Paraglaciecola sp.]